MNLKPLWIDIETRSRCDLIRHGVYRYAADPSTEILIICWALGHAPVRTWFKGQPMPVALTSILAKETPGVPLMAHNAAFERLLLGRQFPAARNPGAGTAPPRRPVPAPLPAHWRAPPACWAPAARTHAGPS